MRSLAGIVVIAVLALGCFGVFGWYLADKNPRLAMQRAIHQQVGGVRVKGIVQESDPATKQVSYRIVLIPDGTPTVTADVLTQVAHAAARALREPDVIAVDYTALEVVAANDGPRGRFERWKLERFMPPRRRP